MHYGRRPEYRAVAGGDVARRGANRARARRGCFHSRARGSDKRR